MRTLADFADRLTTAIAERYLIERELGQGGMATVYLAQDIKHDRKVALKVLRPELAAVIGAERFLAEIKTTANLQHPHILALFDSGEIDGFVYYVMPYVEGETLRARIAREHQLPVDEAVRITREVADALGYAHGHGVVHRDIKPENILLHGGHALVADFGIALAVSRSDGGTRMTETGMSLGTPHYMSPEQAMGEREITPRADVYALGCVLYEMLTGEPPFTGATAQAIIARVMTESPRSLTLQRHTIPPHVEAATLTALEKLPADRFATAGEFAAALGDSGYRTVATATAAAVVGRLTGRTRWLARAGMPLAALLGLVIGAWGWAMVRAPAAAPVSRYGIIMPPAQEALQGMPVVPSPDGSRLAYVGPGGDGIQLWIKARDQFEATPLPGTANVTNFTWSPDGEWIAFTQSTQVKKIPIVGGAAIALADTVSGNPGIAWLDDGSIVFLHNGATVLRRVSAVGGPSERVWEDQANLRSLTPLPGGRGVLFTRCGGFPTCDVWALDLRSGEAHSVLAGAVFGMHIPTGHLVYARRDGAAFAVPFDLGALTADGSPVPVLDSLLVVNDIYPRLAIAASGLLVMRQGAALSLLQRYQMVWVNRDGQETPLDTNWIVRFTSFGANIGWAISPDGRQLAIGLATDAGDDIWVRQLPRGPVSRVSYDSASEYRPRWMPDGRSVMFGSNRTGAGTGGLYVRPANGTGSDSLIVRAQGGVFEGAWSPDGRWLVFRTGGTVAQAGARDIVGIRPGVDSTPVPVIVTPYDEEAIAIAPSGRWIAYESNETGRTEIFLRPFPQTESGKWQVSNGGGVAPLWARNGRELFYIDANRDMMAVPMGSGAEPLAGEPQRLFHLRDEWFVSAQEFYTPFDVAPDGRFLMARSVNPVSNIRAPLLVVDNWFTELRSRIAGGR